MKKGWLEKWIAIIVLLGIVISVVSTGIITLMPEIQQTEETEINIY